MREEEEDQSPTQEEDLLQSLRLRATELLLREQWPESVQAYTHFINLSQHHISNIPKQDDDHHHHHHFLVRLRKSLCLAFSNRAEARSRLKDFDEALKDCEQALRIESTHFKSLVCKGKILMGLNRYSAALDCFKTAVLDPQANGSLETLNGYLEKCRKLEFQSRTGAFDLSEWVLSGFRGKSPELAEYVGAVVIKRSELSGRGLFATKNMDAGTLVLVTRAVATERGILSSEDSSENAQLVMWKNFIEKVVESSAKSERIKLLISTLSTGEDEGELEVPDIGLFKPEGEGTNQSNHEELDKGKILNVLDANSLVEDSVSAKVLGKNSEYYGVGLWLLASFINHSCNPNSRRLHIGDHLIVHASRDIKAGEEITFAYFDVLSPLEKRNESSRTWGFCCSCRRCKFEDACSKQEMKEIEIGLERGGMDAGGAIFRIEEGMRRWMVRGKEKGFLRASYWDAYAAEACNGSERSLVKRRILPNVEVVVESVVEATGSDERVMKVWMEGLKRRKTASSMVEMERALKLGRGIYGKVVKKHALKSLLEFGPFMNTTRTCY